MPERIECFDNSNLGGRVPVASRVVFENGQPLKAAYRTYRIRSVKGPDDYASMTEVLRRRFQKTGTDSRPPDLLMVDGGKGQLNIAVSVLGDLELVETVDVIGIAKRDDRKGELQDKIFKPGRANPVVFGRDGDLLLFLQRIRDEAHRFAIGFHRRRRGKKALASRLESVPGIGPQRRKALLRRFKRLERIRAAQVEEITALPGFHRELALRLKAHLENDS